MSDYTPGPCKLCDSHGCELCDFYGPELDTAVAAVRTLHREVHGLGCTLFHALIHSPVVMAVFSRLMKPAP